MKILLNIYHELYFFTTFFGKRLVWIAALFFFVSAGYLNFQKIQAQNGVLERAPAHWAPVHLSDKKLLNLHPDVFQKHVEASLKWSLKTLAEGDIKYYLHVDGIGTKKTKLFSKKAMKIQEDEQKKKQTVSTEN